MSGMKSDVLVIGGGTAACAAAEAVLQAGKKVTMVFPNGGSSEVSAGSVDILGVVPGRNHGSAKTTGKGSGRFWNDTRTMSTGNAGANWTQVYRLWYPWRKRVDTG